MANERIVHDVAFATSRHILEIFAGCIREEEHKDAFEEIFQCVKAGIESFAIESNRLERRLFPGRN
jgi:hypothetical protein